MSSEREKDIFFEALPLLGEERDRLVEARCGSDEELKSAVERLLQAHDEAQEFLAAPTLEDMPASGSIAGLSGPDLREGDWIGAYQLKSVLGEGGFGRVFLAEQTEPVSRLVAIKLLKAGMDSRKIVARFEAERQALALMDHPCVARVFDGGQAPNGRPYFVMEYVRGETITEYCSRMGLSVRERLALFESVCLAVQHAHNKGIVHRDLKPSNVLVVTVDDRPSPKVIDFGIAKAVGESKIAAAMTVEGQMIGTPAYMSPEQVAGEPGMDTRSDVYTLGVLLYEILTGSLPIETERLDRLSPVALAEAVRVQTPERPSTRVSKLASAEVTRSAGSHQLASKLRGDLDWIVMRALEKEPDRRYQTAFALARDIRRHLDGEPVEAGPPSGLYRLRKFAERHRGELAAAAVVLVTLVGGLISSLIFASRSEQSRKVAERENAMAQETASFAESMLTGLDPAVARGADTTLLRRMLDDSIARLATDPPEHADTEARLRKMIGVGLYKIAAFDEASDQFTLSLRRAREVMPEDDPFVLDTRQNLAQMYIETSRFQEGRSELLGVLETTQRTFGPDDVKTIDARFNLAYVDRMMGHFEQARDGFVGVIEQRERVLGSEHKDTMSARNSLATVLGELGQSEEAIKLYQQVIAFQKRELGPDHPHTLATMNNLADELAAVGREEEALTLLEEVLEAKRRVLDPNHSSLLISINNTASLYGKLGRTAEAERLLRESRGIAIEAFGEDDWRTMALGNNLASHLYKKMDRPEEARTLLDDLLPRCLEVLGPEHRLTLAVMSNLAQVRLALGLIDEAVQVAGDLVRDTDLGMPVEHPDRVGSRLVLARALLASDRWTEAEPVLQMAFDLCQPEPLAAQRRDVAELFADLCDRGGRADEANQWRAMLTADRGD